MKDVRYSVFLALNHISDEAILEAELAPTGGAAAPIRGEIIHGGKDMEREDSSRRKRRAGVLLPFAGWIAAALGMTVSNVDTRTEGAIRSAMRRLMQDRTCFVIAHRLSTVEHADQILVMKDGAVAEAGTHEELLARGGVYAGLYRSQFDTTG